ncbi:FadR family transcriptional regulator [Rhizobium sp. KVB221]|uniref:FadR family transcriptional regulator n=1 Tax=Rhizobium setariae TaxID=2801340 RepID=A0A936YUW9_9HYPH|nr:FadR/GntR family transcriptional regulator [Rhizobium setariae]MBL0375229.1 FadR family transcriptional regulator [Rhizobium setariae]
MEGKALFEAIDAMPSYKRVSLAIEEQIISGKIKPGEALPTEHTLAEQLGVNRSTLREGLRALENAGFIKRAGAKKLIVSIPESSEIAQYTSRAMSLHSVTFAELWEMMIVLEPLSARYAAERAPKDILKLIEANVAETEERLHDDATIIRLDVEFHSLVSQATQNRVLVLSEEPLGLLLYNSTRRLYRASPKARYRLLEAHRKIYEAIASGDADTAETWMRKHIEDFKRGHVIAGFDFHGPVRLPGADG